ncbi:MAG TPA: hypothetical protein VIO56_05450 [Methylotenera sp.]
MSIETLRIALVSTPRSGNTWLRLILGDIYELEHFAVHSPDDLNFDKLPKRCIVQLHWQRSAEFIEYLKKYGFIIVTIGRHPLDVLISILQFCTREPQTAFWLCGEGGDERGIVGKTPLDTEFLNYAKSSRASNLLSVTCDWWNFSTARIQYEDMLAEPEYALSLFVNNIAAPVNDIASSVRKYRFDQLKSSASNGHYWQGKCGIWERVLPLNYALDIFECHRPIFDTLGYPVSAIRLEDEVYLSNWRKLMEVA